jgi:hypothetical protein
MPAFGRFSGRRSVLDAQFRSLLGSGGLAVWMLRHEGLYPVAPRALADDD